MCFAASGKFSSQNIAVADIAAISIEFVVYQGELIALTNISSKIQLPLENICQFHDGGLL